ncbi:MAG: hypothetical protein GY697_20420 [Desulfobacterales bacterium]|nr:hypothetical protein [Desulfobacterales bacterium]
MPEIKDSSAPFGQPDHPATKDADSPPGSDAAAGIERKMIAKASQAVKDHISRQPHVQRLFSFMPTLMTRVSPFHFRNRNLAKDWPLVRLDSGEANTWGQMSVVGELLIIFDETVLFCLLALMKKYRCEAFETDETEICSLAAVSASLANRNSIWRSIQRLTGTRIDLGLLTGKGKKRKAVRQMTGSILTFCDRNTESGMIRVAVNPYFLEMYGESFVTNIDLNFRAGLKDDVSKALYRFLQGQIDTTLSLSLIQLARAINLDQSNDDQSIRRKIRAGLKELKSRNYLEYFNITRGDRTEIIKCSPAELNPVDFILDTPSTIR